MWEAMRSVVPVVEKSAVIRLLIFPFVCYLLGVGVHVSRESLADKHPHHVGRDDERAVVGVGFNQTSEKHVFPRVAEFLPSETGGYHPVIAFLDVLVIQYGFSQFLAALQNQLAVGRRTVLVNNEGDTAFLLLQDDVFLRMAIESKDRDKDNYYE